MKNLEKAMEKIHAGLSIIIREERGEEKENPELREIWKMLDDVLDKLDKINEEK